MALALLLASGVAFSQSTPTGDLEATTLSTDKCMPGNLASAKDHPPITVMTRNLYLGADLDPVIAAASTGPPEAVFDAVTKAWATIVGTDFPARAEALADEIEASEPMLVGLQEVSLYRTGPADGSQMPNATNVEYDYLKILLDELNERDLHYAPVALPRELDPMEDPTNKNTSNFDVEVPGDTDTSPDRVNPQDIRLTDYDVILKRTDLPDSQPQPQFTNVQTGHFANHVILPIGIELKRGWGSVDVTLGGQTFRFINTHLEPESTNPMVNDIQVAQGEEILNGPAKTNLPVILVGDFNSRAGGGGTPTYSNLIRAGFKDAWSVTHPGELGNTWAHDEDLLNKKVNLTQRLDLVLFRDGDVGGLCASDADIVGDELTDRIRPSGLWPSDHAGVVATLRGE
jgi:endonuclease/exonuclease/phosphatase family metal-dependent hydrolase